jgi:hypothetical protein
VPDRPTDTGAATAAVSLRTLPGGPASPGWRAGWWHASQILETGGYARDLAAVHDFWISYGTTWEALEVTTFAEEIATTQAMHWPKRSPSLSTTVAGLVGLVDPGRPPRSRRAVGLRCGGMGGVLVGVPIEQSAGDAVPTLPVRPPRRCSYPVAEHRGEQDLQCDSGPARVPAPQSGAGGDGAPGADAGERDPVRVQPERSGVGGDILTRLH